ncbi:MAG: hypothetical protein J7K84_01605 [Deltaproteobacteria bacterium]|nr:hypothetical protein [Deltaproteobacteria bacterium]
MPDLRYFLIPSIVTGSVTSKLSIRNCSPYLEFVSHEPFISRASPGLTQGRKPMMVTRLLIFSVLNFAIV